MCLAVPVKVIELKGSTAIINADGVKREVNVALINSLAVGDHIIVHAGFAIQKWSQDDVDEYNQLMQEMQTS